MFTRTPNGFVLYNEQQEVIAEITYAPTEDENVVEADHTYVDASLRGQGIAEKLLDTLVEAMAQEGKKIKPTCSYVVKKFATEEKYQAIKA
ncbi:MAG: GNAT family N-acetyltransferase [Aerococcaceae bacterium]|nr:GNAT family N-acetyltransferase [Aerococcaceae bacterium]